MGGSGLARKGKTPGRRIWEWLTGEGSSIAKDRDQLCRGLGTEESLAATFCFIGLYQVDSITLEVV